MWTVISDSRLDALNIQRVVALTSLYHPINYLVWQRTLNDSYKRKKFETRQDTISVEIDIVDYILQFEGIYDVIES